MKLYAPTHEPVHISLLNGHATLITAEGTDVDKQFIRDALDRGCLTKPDETNSKIVAESDDEEIDNADSYAERKQIIKNAINDMLNGTNEGDFNADGKPDLRKLSGRTGFKVSRPEMEVVFAELAE